jgi:DNA-binding IclR family transcriptional regulator
VVRNGESAICLDRQLSSRGTSFFARIGSRLPYHTCSSGKVLLAYMDGAGVEAIIAAGLKRYAAKTVTSPVVLRKQLREVRRVGYAITEDELDSAITSIASPIRDPAGHVTAAISVAGPTSRFPATAVEETLARVREASEQISSIWYASYQSNYAAANGVDSIG